MIGCNELAATLLFGKKTLPEIEKVRPTGIAYG